MIPFEITLLSGKGGTGKTTFSASFIALSHPAVLAADLDVDASNLPIILETVEIERESFSGMELAVIDSDSCTGCGKCLSVCRFDAIDHDLNIMEERCEGCGVCSLVCPVNAIELVRRKEGDLLVSETRFGTMVHSELRPGGEGSGKLVSLIRSKAREIASERSIPLIISDGPPGIGCPVISSLTGTDLAVVITEPSPSGMTDLIRILDLCSHFGIKTTVIVNRCDIDEEISQKIIELVKEKGSTVIGEIPFDMSVYDSLSRGRTLVECEESPVSTEVKSIWNRILDRYVNGK
jgi:MinD superfamily P-loop ATPase